MTYVPGNRPTEEWMERSATTSTVDGGWDRGVSLGADNTGEIPLNSGQYGHTGRYYWYGEHDTLYENPELAMTGGIGACSTNDFIVWKNEGIMMHFVNITDDVFFTSNPLRAERPRVLYNNATDRFVMWAASDMLGNVLRLAMTAVSEFPNGPYFFNRTLHPDGNGTVDLQLFQDPNGDAYLARTYYVTVDYWLPEPVMQPLWESVKSRSCDAELAFNYDGCIDFSLNYHRAFYHPGYDNPDDIYLQRWRHEDVAWAVFSDPWLETFDELNGTYRLSRPNPDATQPDIVVTYTPAERELQLNLILDVHADREVRGQGKPPILSRYKDPTDPENNAFVPGSVPAVRAQEWGANYLDKNIADNPVHPTVPDRLIGPEQNVESRRAKYLAVSLLSHDYLDTTGVVRIMEGSLEEEKDLIAVINDYGRFGWEAGDLARSTYAFPIDGQEETGPTIVVNKPFNFFTEADWYDRFYQFCQDHNDRNFSFVNFRDQFLAPAERGQYDQCPPIHQEALDTRAHCVQLYNNLQSDAAPSQINSNFELKSYSQATSTTEYEACLAQVRDTMQRYLGCISASLGYETPQRACREGACLSMCDIVAGKSLDDIPATGVHPGTVGL
jgi:hypothetical protein